MVFKCFKYFKSISAYVFTIHFFSVSDFSDEPLRILLSTDFKTKYSGPFV